MLAVAQTNASGFHIGTIQDNSYVSSSQNCSDHQHNSSQHKNYSHNQIQQKYSVRLYYPNQKLRICNSHIFYGIRAKHCRPWCQWPNKPANILKNNEKTPANSRPSSPKNA